MTTWPSITLQNSSSPLMEQLIMFHDHIMFILTMIVTVVMYIMIMMLKNNYSDRNLLESQLIELIWTVTPAATLFFIATPSLRLLYLMDEINNPSMTIKAIGHQWFWSYEYSDLNNTEMESYMMSLDNTNNIRLMDVDNRLILPSSTLIRMLVTSTDVIHSWTIPSTGVKIDSMPGRLNQTKLMINRNTLLFGQCSEICGANHSFMPIVVESIPIKSFIKWMSK
nr:cytochrome c oxidase subunit II [Carausius morosus]